MRGRGVILHPLLPECKKGREATQADFPTFSRCFPTDYMAGAGPHVFYHAYSLLVNHKNLRVTALSTGKFPSGLSADDKPPDFGVSGPAKSSSVHGFMGYAAT